MGEEEEEKTKAQTNVLWVLVLYSSIQSAFPRSLEKTCFYLLSFLTQTPGLWELERVRERERESREGQTKHPAGGLKLLFHTQIYNAQSFNVVCVNVVQHRNLLCTLGVLFNFYYPNQIFMYRHYGWGYSVFSFMLR